MELKTGKLFEMQSIFTEVPIQKCERFNNVVACKQHNLFITSHDYIACFGLRIGNWGQIADHIFSLVFKQQKPLKA
jgi:hypothetical protein